MSTFSFLKKSGEAVFTDDFVTKAGELLVQYDGTQQNPQVGMVGVPLSKSSISHSGAALAPTTIRKMLNGFTTYSIEDDIDLAGNHVVDYGDILMHVTDIRESQQRISHTIEEILRHHKPSQLIILGGDHSISYPSITAFSKFHKVGVIQFDAHHDLRNLEDGGPSNGTPFRSLIESNIIEGKNLVQIGIRDFMNSKAYREYAREKGITVYSMKEVRQRSIKVIIHEAINGLKEQVDMIYVSVDVDVLDQAFAPGCPAIGPGGMDSETLIEAIEHLGACELVKGMDIVEIDPMVDFRDMTSKMAAWLLLTFLKARVKS